MSVAPHSRGRFVADLHCVERAGGVREVVRLRKQTAEGFTPAVYFEPKDIFWVITALTEAQSRLWARAA